MSLPFKDTEAILYPSVGVKFKVKGLLTSTLIVSVNSFFVEEHFTFAF